MLRREPWPPHRATRSLPRVAARVALIGKWGIWAMRRSPLIILFTTVLIDLLGFGIILPLLPLYVEQFGGTPVVAGWLATSFSAMQFLFAPLWGRLSDVHGRRPFILLSLIGSALAFLLFGLARALWVLFAARIAAGVLTAASLPTAQAYIADVTPPERRARGMAMIGVAFGIGFSAGPALGGWLGRLYGLAVPAYVVAGLAALNFVWSYFALPESLARAREPAPARRLTLIEPRRFASAFRTPLLGELLAVFAVSTFAFAMMEATFTWLILLRFVEPALGPGVTHAMVEKQAAATAGSVFVIVGVTAVLAQGAVMGGLAQVVSERWLMWMGAALLTGSLVGIGAAGSLAALKVLAAGLAVGSSMLNPVLSSLVSKAARHGERGGVLGVQQGLGSLARMVAPPLGTWVLQRFGTDSAYYAAGGLMGVAFLASLFVKEPARWDEPPSPPIAHI